MFKNVLVGVDGRSNGRDAIALASRLTDPAGKLTLAHVHSGQVHPLHAITPGLVREEREASQKLLAAELEAADVDAELVAVEDATPGSGLHRRAEEQGADLLVVGSCSRGLMGRVMLGDDTRASLNGAPCAVAIAARGYAESPAPLARGGVAYNGSSERKAAPVARVGVAYNGSSESKAALATAIAVAAPAGAEVRAMEVVSIPTYAFTGLVPPAFGETVELMLSEGNARMRELDGAEGRAVYGLAGEELAAFGDEVDLLVVGARSYGPVRRLVVGSTSDHLERHARCSLLVLPRAGEED